MGRGFVERHRAEIVAFIVLPISFLIWIYRSVQRKVFAPSPSGHAKRVERVSKEVIKATAIASNSCNTSNAAVHNERLLRTDRSAFDSHSVRNADKSTAKKVKLCDLYAILGLERDPQTNTMVVHVEPGVTVGEVTSYLLNQPQPLQLLCTLEMEDATLGGLAMAQGMTTHSHVCGLLSETVVEYEIVSARGEVLTVRAENEHFQLFRALPMSHGTLGLLVSLKLRVLPSKKFVRLRYTPLRSQAQLSKKYHNLLQKASKQEHSDTTDVSKNKNDIPFFAEAIVFSHTESVWMQGWLTDGPEADEKDGLRNANTKINCIGWWFKPWFYKHVQSMLEVDNKLVAANKGDFAEEYIPIRQYLMRHDRSMCMTMGTLIPYGNHWLFRWFMGMMLPPQMSFLKSSHTKETREQSIRLQCYQDICFPSRLVTQALDMSHKLFNIYPLLVYPCKFRSNIDQPPSFVTPNPADVNDNGIAMYLNLGIYGIPQPIRDKGPNVGFPMVSNVRKLEEWLRDVSGFQHTYCDSFQTEAEFEQMFDHEHYNRMREAYSANGVFPRVYAKTRPEMNIWTWLEEEQKQIIHESTNSLHS